MSPFFALLVLTDIILLGLLIAPRLLWVFKLVAIVLVFGSCFIAWSAQDSGAGWPVSAPLPDPAQAVTCVVVEPDPSSHTRGAIYVWMIPLDFHHGILSYRPEGFEPRAYAQPYNRSLHEACEAVKKANGRGKPATIRRVPTRRHHGDGQVSSGKFRAYRLPPPALPKKEDS
jgi:hypothetical protein